MVKLSVVIPVFNAQEYLRECLNSILSQTFKDIEVICVDDGSTDASLDILKEYAQRDQRVCVLSQKNKHAGVARNYGASAATGDYIHFMDADDLLYGADVYEHLFSLMEQYGFENVIRFRAEAFDCNTGKKLKGKYYEGNSFEYNRIYDFSNVNTLSSFLCLKASVVPWQGFVRRDFMKENHLQFNDLYSCNDRSFFISSVLLAGKLLLLDVFGVKHRVNNRDSLVGRRDQHFECDLKSVDIVRDFLKEQQFSEDVCKRVLVWEFSSPFRFFLRHFQTSPYKYDIYCQMRKFVSELNVSFYSPYIKNMWYFDWLKKIKRSSYFPPKIGQRMVEKSPAYDKLKRLIFSFEKKEARRTLYVCGLPVYKIKVKKCFERIYILGIPVFKFKVENSN